jgi:hypothetical protein
VEKQFRVISWNCKRALANSRVWDYLLDLDPTIALLQEVGTIPTHVRSEPPKGLEDCGDCQALEELIALISKSNKNN